ncbi:2-oxo-4-hydroxy-4-carboxy-5-ureidoimidazoline decarboxylase [Demequina sp.]|uniref:2-oxo-4-hydroxy-4-carboxy-5-ureidoimidazoline decarboxylase n=1 Tax=Demequina sp. TaxID=2050685 RepID=UPI0025C29784|nr:2-oxo-4-hydroxy-4-carboxy-5-ureidoimidazoline decarboxylase [Demequina sp.]
MVPPLRGTLLTCLRIERWADDLSGRSYNTMLERERTAVAAATSLSTADLTGRLADGRAAYQQRFGRTFVIRAEGRDLAEEVTELERRLANDDVAELAEIANQLRGIALVRLRAAYSDQFDAA